MSFIVSARKYRPQNFDEIVGQNHITTSLKNSIDQGRIAHAYLFSGPRGTGKTSSARILAKALNCKEGPTPKPCDKCTNCVEITNGRSLDVLEIDGASNGGVDQVRELRERIKYSPNNSKYKIYIIDEVHMLTDQAFNALLKTLEEPPQHVIFILATTELHKVKLTIRSRCQVYIFKRISIEILIGQLEKICRAEKIKAEPEALFHIAKQSDGCVRDSQSFLDQIIAYCGNNVTEKDVKDVLGIIDSNYFIQFIEYLTEKDISNIFEIVHTLWLEGRDLNDFTKGLVEYFRDLLLIKSLNDKKIETSNIINLSKDDIKQLVKLREHFTKEQIINIINILIALHKELKTAINSQYLFESNILRIINYDNIISPGETLRKLEKLQEAIVEQNPNLIVEENTEQKLETKLVSPKEKEKIKPDNDEQDLFSIVKNDDKTAPKTKVDVEEYEEDDELNDKPIDEKAVLKQLRVMIENKHKVLATYLENAVNVKISDKKFTIYFNDTFIVDSIKDDKSYIDDMVTALFKICNKNYTISVQYMDKKQTSENNDNNQAEKLLLDLFDGTMIE